MTALAELLQQATAQLRDVSDTARLDAELLLAHCLGKDRTFLFTWPDHRLEDRQQADFRALLARRAEGEPVAYLVGHREFFGHRFFVSPATLIPRPETELLVETALARLPEENIAVADLGTGTGAIALSLALARPGWRVLAVDLTREILDLAERNMRALGASNVTLLQGSWLAPVKEPLDAIVSNPPYIADGDPHLRQGDVRFEPASALVAGQDGLDDIRLLADQALSALKPGGLLLVEHGFDQGAAVRSLFADAGLAQAETLRDLAGQDRVTVGRKPDHA